jgi:hypothetical protein
MSMAQHLEPDVLPLRPTRAAPCAPFVSAPPAPRVARAPAVCGEGQRERGMLEPALAFGGEPGSALALVEGPADARWLGALASLAMVDELDLEIRALVPVGGALGPPTPSPALSRVARVASALGALGAVIGGVAFAGGEGSLPMIGWLPGPVIGAATGAGVLGLAGVVLGAIASLFARGRTKSPGSALAYVRVRTEDRDALLAAVVRGGGRIVACSNGA